MPTNRMRRLGARRSGTVSLLWAAASSALVGFVTAGSHARATRKLRPDAPAHPGVSLARIGRGDGAVAAVLHVVILVVVLRGVEGLARVGRVHLGGDFFALEARGGLLLGDELLGLFELRRCARENRR